MMGRFSSSFPHCCCVTTDRYISHADLPRTHTHTTAPRGRSNAGRRAGPNAGRTPLPRLRASPMCTIAAALSASSVLAGPPFRRPRRTSGARASSRRSARIVTGARGIGRARSSSLASSNGRPVRVPRLLPPHRRVNPHDLPDPLALPFVSSAVSSTTSLIAFASSPTPPWRPPRPPSPRRAPSRGDPPRTRPPCSPSSARRSRRRPR